MSNISHEMVVVKSDALPPTGNHAVKVYFQFNNFYVMWPKTQTGKPISVDGDRYTWNSLRSKKRSKYNNKHLHARPITCSFVCKVNYANYSDMLTKYKINLVVSPR